MGSGSRDLTCHSTRLPFACERKPLSIQNSFTLIFLNLTVEPCKRYYINGKYDNRVGVSWQPFIDYEEVIAGCTVTAAK